MSVLRPLLSRRGRLALLATALLLMAALVAAPSVSGAKAAVKQVAAKILPPDTAVGGMAGTWTEQVFNCGGPTVAPPCTAASTIGLGQVRITVPLEFRPITGTVTATIPAPSAKHWSASYDSGTGIIRAQAVSGSDKLGPGEMVNITFSATPATCSTGSKQFITTGLGSLPSSPDGEIFQLVGSQPAVTVTANGDCLESGDSITDPGGTGQTETITGDFTGHVLVTFGGETADCGFVTTPVDPLDPDGPTLGDQWDQYHLPTQVSITPGSDFHAGSGPKVSTSEFPQTFFGGDSSWYLICYAVPHDADHPDPFQTKGPPGSHATEIGGNWVGILDSCDVAPTPCVSEQFLTTGPGGPPWIPSANKVHIAIRMQPGDPFKR
jgi:hypothetical protein